MAEKKIIELEVKTNSASLKAQLREAQQEVQALSEKFGITSKEAVNAAKKAAELKDAIGDAKALTEAFNPDAKFNALSTSIGGVLNGFQAFEGALGLVGVEGKAVQEQLLKVQSAMALADGISGVIAAKDAFLNLGTVIREGLVKAFSSLKSAIITTGIGALVIAIGILIPKIMDWIDSTEEINDANKKFNDTLDKQNGLIDKQTKQLKERQDVELKRAKARGASEKEILDIEKVQLDERDKLYKKSIQNINDGIKQKTGAYKWALKEEEWELAKSIQKEIKALEKQKGDIIDNKRSEHSQLGIEQTQFFYDTKQKRADDLKDAQEKIDAASLKSKEKRNAELEKQRQDARANIEAGKLETIEQLQAIENAENEYYKSKKTARQQDLDDVNNKYFALLESAKINAIDTTTLLEAQRIAEKDINDKYDKEESDKKIAAFNKSKERADKEMADAKAISDAKFNITRDSFTTIGNLATAFAGKSEKEQKRAFDIQKAANIAGATMDTYKSAQSAYAALAGIPVVGPGLGIAAAASAIAAGLVNVKNISSQQFTGGGSAGGSPSSTSGGGDNNQVVTPRFNIIGSQNQTQLAQLNQAPIKAYVVGSDVTTQQMLDKKKIQNATL
jgi:hypothetical protein